MTSWKNDVIAVVIGVAHCTAVQGFRLIFGVLLSIVP